MFRNYLTIAIRNIARYKIYSFINIAGLAMGMACCALIMLYVQHELSYDHFHAKKDRIYRVLQEINSADGQVRFYAGISGAFKKAVQDAFPEVEEVVRISTNAVRTATIGGKRVQLKDPYKKNHPTWAVESNFLDVFDFPMVKGNRQTALQEPFSAIVSETFAQRHFGNEDPIGKVITPDGGYFPGNFTVTGVVSVPEQSSFKFGIATALFSSHAKWERWDPPGWNNLFFTMMVLREGVDHNSFEAKLPDFREQHLGKEARENGRYHLQPLLRIYNHTRLDFSSIGNERLSLGDIQRIYLFSGIAFLILLIACINFMTLSTARSANRSKEVGIRKVSGALRAQLIRQFLGEAILLSVLAFFLSLCLVTLTLPTFSAFVGKELTLYQNLYQALITAALVMFVGLLSGIYPAFFLSSFEPIATLKSHLKSGLKGLLLRRGLVVFQFALSILLIIGTVTLYRQLSFLQNKDMGFDKDHLIMLQIFTQDKRTKLSNPEARLSYRYETVKQAFLAHPNVLSASAYAGTPGVDKSTRGKLMRTAEGKPHKILAYCSDEDFLTTMGMSLIAGRDLRNGDMRRNDRAVIINETAVKSFGWEDPIGKPIDIVNNRGLSFTVVGVVKDFHNVTLREKIQPQIYYSGLDFYRMMLKVKGENLPETVAFLEKTYKQLAPSLFFSFSFFDEDLNHVYQNEQRVGQLVGMFALLAVMVACLGLFGLAAFTAEQRTKEIGVRKMLGASTKGIVLLLSTEFAKLVLVANLIAWPAAYFAVDNWLQNFAYRVDLSWWVFALGGLLTLLIALATVGYQAVRAALTNPIEALKYE